MAFPADLTDVALLKIHPAIGIARVSKNDDYFVFGTKPATYKSNGLMKRQAVQFRIFAYGPHHLGLGELTPQIMSDLGITPVWSAEVANRKLELTARLNQQPSDPQRVFGARASSDDGNNGELKTSLAGWDEGAGVALGQIRSDGLFIPPKAAVHRKVSGATVPDYPNFTWEIADSTSDGVIRVELDGPAAALPVVPAWIVVAPQDYSPDQHPVPTREESLLVHLKGLVTSGSGSTGTIHNETARRIDEQALEPATADWAPGFEVSFGDRSEVGSVASLFYNGANDPEVDQRDIRVRLRTAAGSQGAVPGQLTSGLCSPWQTDFTACVGYWSESLPQQAYLDEATNRSVNVYRRRYGDGSPFPDALQHGDDFEQHQDKVGIVRIVNGKAIETERDPGDDF